MPPQTRLWEFCNKIIVFLLKLYIKVHRHKEAVHLDFLYMQVWLTLGFLA